MAVVRSRKKRTSYSSLANAAYEMYPDAKGGNALLRGNILRVLARLDEVAADHADRVETLAGMLQESVMIPDCERLLYVVPFFPGDNSHKACTAFRQSGFDDTFFHIDIAGNLFAPIYRKALLIPVNTRIPRSSLDRLVERLQPLAIEN